LQLNSQSSQSASSSSNPISNDFAALGQALQSGDLNAAQSAFSQLQTDLKAGASGSGHVHHGHHHQEVSSTPDSQPASSSSGSTNATINLLA
jgi:hypothetical protein